MPKPVKSLKIDDEIGEFLEFGDLKVVNLKGDKEMPICDICAFKQKCRLQNPRQLDAQAINCLYGVYVPATEEGYLLAKLRGETE